MATHNDTGKYGENEAAKFLKKKGYLVLKKNYRYQRSEVDLIVQKDNLIVFVEVKVRKNRFFGNPEEFVSEAQAERILEAAEAFQEEWQGNYAIRFDIVSITGKPPFFKIEHFEDAFF